MSKLTILLFLVTIICLEMTQVHCEKKDFDSVHRSRRSPRRETRGADKKSLHTVPATNSQPGSGGWPGIGSVPGLGSISQLSAPGWQGSGAIPRPAAGTSSAIGQGIPIGRQASSGPSASSKVGV